MTRLCEQHYQEFWCTLKCGQLETRVQLFPAPQPASQDCLGATYTLSNQLHVIGFLTQQDLGAETENCYHNVHLVLFGFFVFIVLEHELYLQLLYMFLEYIKILAICEPQIYV